MATKHATTKCRENLKDGGYQGIKFLVRQHGRWSSGRGVHMHHLSIRKLLLLTNSVSRFNKPMLECPATNGS
jgi:hypothetical protein